MVLHCQDYPQHPLAFHPHEPSHSNIGEWTIQSTLILLDPLKYTTKVWDTLKYTSLQRVIPAANVLASRLVPTVIPGRSGSGPILLTRVQPTSDQMGTKVINQRIDLGTTS